MLAPGMSPEHFTDTEPTVVDELLLALESNDQAAIAQANTAYIDAIFSEAQQNNGNREVYTEIHQVKGNLIITPSIDSGEVHWASVYGQHSFFDAITPPQSFSAARDQQQVLGQRLGLSHETVVGKGTIQPATEQPGYALLIQNIRLHNTYDWLHSLGERTSAYENISIEYEPDYLTQHQPLEHGFPLRTYAAVYPQTVRLANEMEGIVAGVVTGVEELSPPTVTRSNKSLHRQATLVLESVEGRTDTHAPVIEAAGISDHGVFTINMGELSQRLYIRYGIDRTNDRSYVLINYLNPEQSPDFDDLRTMVVAAVNSLTESLISKDGDRVVNEYFDNNASI